jgi:uncharacterized protein YkwD
MNLIDVLLGIIVLLAIWSGWQKGFIVGSLGLISWLSSLYLGFYFYPYAANFIKQYITDLGVWTLPVAFISVILLSRILFSVIIWAILRATPIEAHRSGFNHFLGIIPGFIKGVIYATLIAALLLAFPIADGLSAETRESEVATKLSVGVEWMNEEISPVFDKAIHQTINKLTVDPNSEKSVELPFTTTHYTERPDLEAKMVNLVNEERVKRGFKPLAPDPELKRVAINHSKDMFARGYFSHYTPEQKDPFDRMREAGVKFSAAGENLALAQTLEIAHTGLMNSPGHRDNILRPNFGRIGIGIIDGGVHGLMISQEFRN